MPISIYTSIRVSHEHPSYKQARQIGVCVWGKASSLPRIILNQKHLKTDIAKITHNVSYIYHQLFDESY